MITIRSNREVAQTYANQLANTCQNLTAVSEVTKDTVAESEGNTHHHAVIDQAKSFSAQIIAAVETASDRLHSVASDFEAVDQAGAESFENKHDRKMGSIES